MAWTKEDWEKSRGTGDHFTDADIEIMRKGYRTGQPARVIARELQCSIRSVHKWFGRFKADHGPIKRNRAERKRPDEMTASQPRFDAAAHREKRFYRGSFDL